jgi:hypothetical protein
MSQTMAARIAALRDMTVDELRAKHREVFGEETRSRHKDFLWKRIAWRLQAQEEGDLSERAKRRAAELANDADVRVRAPQGAFGRHDAPPKERTRVHALHRVHDPRLPMPGTVLTREYKGRVLRVTVLDDGFEFEGRVYSSLSALATEVTGARWNGFLFFGLTAARAAAAGGVR